MFHFIASRAPEIIVVITTVAQGYTDSVNGNIVFAIKAFATIASAIIGGTIFAYIAIVIIYSCYIIYMG
jgi:hypothetical protein